MPLLAALLLLADPARADVPPPNTEDCSDKAAGDACETDDGAKGGCVKSTCSRLDYSQGTPPGSVEYECLICDPAAGSGSTICGVVDPSAALGPLLLAAVLPLVRRRRG